MCNVRNISMLLRKRNIKKRFARRGFYTDICRKFRKIQDNNEVFQHDTR